MPPFRDRKTFGKAGQDVLINFLERHFGYKFEAGERYGEVLNHEYIEELEHCEYLPPIKGKRGARLKFYDTEGRESCTLTMPDMFVSRNSKSGFYWIEAKTHSTNDPRLIIDRDNFDDYAILYNNFTRQDFYVMCLTPSESGNHDVYWCEIQSLLNNKPTQSVLYGNPVYIWVMVDVMSKLNKYPIDIGKYQ
jgi:hypothetical protein